MTRENLPLEILKNHSSEHAIAAGSAKYVAMERVPVALVERPLSVVLTFKHPRRRVQKG
jgi:hypothetical protein